jgi:hypothetical protein
MMPLWSVATKRQKYLNQVVRYLNAKLRRSRLMDSVDRWTNLYVIMSSTERVKKLRDAAFACLSQQSTSPLLHVLSEHAVWSVPRRSLCMLGTSANTSSAPFHGATFHNMNGTFVGIQEHVNVSREKLQRRNRRRVMRLQQEQRAGLRALTPDTRIISVEQVVSLQAALSRDLHTSNRYWRAVDGFSAILQEQQRQSAFAMRGKGGSDTSDDDSARGTLNTASTTTSMSTNYETQRDHTAPELTGWVEPAPSVGIIAEKTLASLSFEQAAYFSLYKSRSKNVRQILPEYLGGRYAKHALERLHKQVHPMFPLKTFKQWEDLAETIQHREEKSRRARERKRVAEMCMSQEAVVRTAYDTMCAKEEAVRAAQQKIEELRQETQKHNAEAQRLDDENPFANKKEIRRFVKLARASEKQTNALETDLKTLAPELEGASADYNHQRAHLQRLAQSLAQLRQAPDNKHTQMTSSLRLPDPSHSHYGMASVKPSAHDNFNTAHAVRFALDDLKESQQQDLGSRLLLHNAQSGTHAARQVLPSGVPSYSTTTDFSFGVSLDSMPHDNMMMEQGAAPDELGWMDWGGASDASEESGDNDGLDSSIWDGAAVCYMQIMYTKIRAHIFLYVCMCACVSRSELCIHVYMVVNPVLKHIHVWEFCARCSSK